MRTLALITIAAALAMAPAAAQQQQQQQRQGSQPQKPDPKADAKEAPTVAGKWNVRIQTDQGERLATLDVTLEGRKVAGTIASDMGESPIAGEYADRKLTFSLTMQTANGDFSLAFAGALKEDDTLAGTMDYGQGAINWTANRIKEK
jgi:hemolysin activation/secretion protein